MIGNNTYFDIENLNKFSHFISGYTPETQQLPKEVNTVLSLTILISELLINNYLCYFSCK